MKFPIRRFVTTMLACALLPISSWAGAAKVHVISFGKWTTVPWVAGSQDEKPQTLKVRALMVDGRVKEYVLGSPHDVTERLFVVRRAFRVNDALPDESSVRWQWQRGGWLLVDRSTAKITPVSLPEFDPLLSPISWYRDYAAYCGVSDDGKKIFAIVSQLSRRKAVLKTPLAGEAATQDAAADSACPAPVWARDPMRVTFASPTASRVTYVIRGHVVDLVDDDEEEEALK